MNPYKQIDPVFEIMGAMNEPRHIVVIGAGVSGLTTALQLCQVPWNKVTIIAKHMPGDYVDEYASPWAGANWLPVSAKGSRAARWDESTWEQFFKYATNLPEAGIHFQETHLYNRKKDLDVDTSKPFTELAKPRPWFADVLKDFKPIPQEELPAGYDYGNKFTSVCINTAIYLPFLVSELLKLGAVLKRGELKHISEAQNLHDSGKKANLIINCTGLRAATLGGVEDKNVFPARGQIVVVRNSSNGLMLTNSGTDDGPEEVMYVMERAAGGGTVLGGSYQKNNWNPEPDPNLAIRIMKRCVEMCPALTMGKGIEALSIVRHSVGFRPFRVGGARLEKEIIDGVEVIHNYGHAGFGYQCSWGCAEELMGMVEGRDDDRHCDF